MLSYFFTFSSGANESSDTVEWSLSKTHCCLQIIFVFEGQHTICGFSMRNVSTQSHRALRNDDVMHTDTQPDDCSNLLVQLGCAPDQVPLARHCLVVAPLSR